MSETEQEVISFAHKQGMIRPRDLAPMGIPQMYLQRLYEKGVLLRSGRGIYLLADADISEHSSLAEVCKRIPSGIICLLSALRFHELGTQSPHEVWLAIDRKARHPHIDYPPVRIVRFAEATRFLGMKEHQTTEGTIRVYDPAKTVVDCFRYRNKIGMDVALEALRDFRQQSPSGMTELWEYAKVLRISTVMRPYIEATSF